MATAHRHVHFSVLLGVAWALAAVLLLAWRWQELGTSIFDADDAMRLVQVREFLGGRGWFDLHEPRLDPPAGYDGHWSRLIDLGLAGLFFLARPFVDVGSAEIFMRAVWPLLSLLVAIGAVASLAWRIAGRDAAVLALVIAASAVPAFQHFKPGTIDHHNVQIALAVATIAAAAWADRLRGASILAGVLTGLALTIGLENIFFVAMGGVTIALRFVVDGRPGGQPLSRYGVAVAGSLGIGFLLGVGPDHWGQVACDALAMNWVAPGLVAGLGLAAVGRMTAEKDSRIRALAVVAVGVLALALFVVIEPRCLRGPFALADDAIRSIWLDGVDETEPLLRYISGYPFIAIWLCTFPVVAMLATFMLASDGAMRRNPSFLLAAAVFFVSIVTALAATKVYSYAMWFGMPLVAAAAGRVTLESGLRANVARFAMAVICAPLIVTAIGMIVAQAIAAPHSFKPGYAERQFCMNDAAYAELAALPKGLVVTDIDYGSHALALTPHAVLAAPYHRLHRGIVDAYAIYHGPLERAHALAGERKIDYIAVCGTRAPTGEVPAAGSLWAELNEGRLPNWLERMPGASPMAVYRVRGARQN